MESRRNSSSMIAVVLCLSWMISFVRGEVGSFNTASTHSADQHHHNNNKADDNDMMKELKEIVSFLSEKIDDSDARIRSLEEKVDAQEGVIQNLVGDVNDASSFHRFLESDDSDCLPKLSKTLLGTHCDFHHVSRFHNRTYFNDDVVFNENVEFDANATNCLPTYNSTTRMCRYDNNITFGNGTILFENDVRFNDTVEFDDDVSFRDRVTMEHDVDFNNGGQVTFNKPTKFTDDLLIKNEDHDIEFKIEDRVKVKFYQDRTMEVDAYVDFYKDVEIKKDLQVNEKLRVKKKATLDDLELYGYLWVDGYTRLDGDLEANNHATVKKGLTVDSGGLDVTKDGAHIVGTSELDGTLKLHGDGYVDQKFNVNGKLTARSVLIDDNWNHNRNLQQTADGYGQVKHPPTRAPVPHPTQAPVSVPLLEVRGDADIDGSLHANEIRSSDINFDTNKNEVDLDQIVNQVKVELREASMVFGDLAVINNFNQEEAVLTEKRMVELMNSANLKVDTITANKAIIDGKNFPVTDDGDPITSEEIVRLLRNQNLSVNSLEANTADIGDRLYPHTDPVPPPVPDNDITSDEIVLLLKGQRLDVQAITADTATIADEVYPLPTSPPINSPSVIDLDQIVKELKVYKGEVTIPKLVSIDLDVISAVEPSNDNSLGYITSTGRLRLNGANVAVDEDIVNLQNEIKAVQESTEDNNDNEGVTTEEIVQALQGASLSIYSLEASSSISKSGAEVATMDDMNDLVGEVMLAADSNTAAPASCMCGAADIESVVTPTFVQDMVDKTYVESLGFTTENLVDKTYVESLGFTTEEAMREAMAELDLGIDCTCTEADVQENIDKIFLDSLGVTFKDDVPEGCTCSSYDIEQVVSADYIESMMLEMDVSFGETEVSCTCSEEDIMSVVTYDYIVGQGFNDEVPECVCEIEDTQIEGIISQSYISGLGFLDTCPCGGTDDGGDGGGV